ncbi:uncharacterized protein LOC116286622 [Actinia tenebrosa]|uniref:Uncharacterized protein LOC116286622 n=1 Tax=Actinia tenebrosa TaxID=6105 RepID=A0A6P8GXN4_ACTTE|nr:uncharacterized protein LOC116286622 [Actinia tenebrosa]
MVGRTQLAIVDHNNNSNREQAITKKGEGRYRVVFPKTRKTWVAKPVLTQKSYSFVNIMVDEIAECHKNKKTLPKIQVPEHIPKNIATVKRPPKEEVVKKHISRMIKKKKEKSQSNDSISDHSTRLDSENQRIRSHLQDQVEESERGCTSRHMKAKPLEFLFLRHPNTISLTDDMLRVDSFCALECERHHIADDSETRQLPKPNGSDTQL